MFPLHVVLFPGRPLPLHLFEQRYRTMLEDCESNDGVFGVVAIRAGREVGEDAELFRVGTTARITRVERLKDGRANILAIGEDRFRIVEQLPADPYNRAIVDGMDDVDVNEAPNGRAAALRERLGPYLRGLGASPDILERLPDDSATLAWLGCAALQIEVPEQQRLLELGSTAERVTQVTELIKRESGIMRRFGTVSGLRPPGPGGAALN